MNNSKVTIFSKEYDMSQDHDLSLFNDLVEMSEPRTREEIAKALAIHIRQTGENQIDLGEEIGINKNPTMVGHIILNGDIDEFVANKDKVLFDLHACDVRITVDGILVEAGKLNKILDFAADYAETQILSNYAKEVELTQNIEAEIERRAEQKLERFRDKMIEKTHDTSDEIMNLWWNHLHRI